MLDRPGIYRITNTSNGRVYFGSSNEMGRRMRTHLGQLRRGTHALGCKRSVETRARMAEARRAYWSKKKGEANV